MYRLACVVGAVFVIVTSAFAAEAPKVTEPFRDEHKEIRVHLDHMSAMSAAVRSSEDPGTEMQRLISALKSHIVAHAEWEEEILYPVVDRYAGAGQRQFTESMRYEHRIVGNWLAELSALAESPEVNRLAFAQRADQLLGLISAHFEVEEEVLLPVLDAGMSPAEFQSEILDNMHAH